jgi:hypothetical protein
MARDYPKSEVLDIIDNVAAQRGINRDDFLRFAYIETGGTFDETANRGPKSAKGLFQFVPDTARAYGIEGRELDPRANTNAAAQLYLDNRQVLLNRHKSNGMDYLSGKESPDGFDMYMAHQQGANGYRSIQKAIADGSFERSDTRSKILNNISSRDVEQLTGVKHRDLSKLSDRDLATTFTTYWDVKFDRISIPEKGISPVVGGSPAVSSPTPTPTPTPAGEGGMGLERAHALTLQYDHVKYGLGAKNPDQGQVDCSGWVVRLQNATMDEINQKAGKEIFSSSDKFSPGYDGAAMIVDKAQKRSGVLLEGSQVTAAAMREGMIIGEDNGAKSWDAGRYKGIDHIVMVVRDPSDGQLKVSQSRGGEGVELSSLDSYLANKQARGVALFATDPLHQARDLIRGQTVAAEPTVPGQPASSSPAEPALLQLKAKGPAVEQLQAALAGLGYTDPQGKPLAADRVFGPDTDAAVRAFQKDMGLEVDGVVGPKTRQALEQAREQVLLSDSQHPQHSLFTQAREKLAGLDPAPYGTDPARLDRAAAHLAVDAHASGLSRIDQVRISADGRSLFPVETGMGDMVLRRGMVVTAQADQHSMLESSRSIDANASQFKEAERSQAEQPRMASGGVQV